MLNILRDYDVTLSTFVYYIFSNETSNPKTFMHELSMIYFSLTANCKCYSD